VVYPPLVVSCPDVADCLVAEPTTNTRRIVLSRVAESRTGPKWKVVSGQELVGTEAAKKRTEEQEQIQQQPPATEKPMFIP
jgi:hypothetical protein